MDINKYSISEEQSGGGSVFFLTNGEETANGVAEVAIPLDSKGLVFKVDFESSCLEVIDMIEQDETYHFILPDINSDNKEFFDRMNESKVMFFVSGNDDKQDVVFAVNYHLLEE